jgi:hypothetical protein
MEDRQAMLGRIRCRIFFLSSEFTIQKYKHKTYKAKIFLVLYGDETWSHTLREKYRLMVSENRVLRRIFEPNMDAVTEEWRKLHNEELHVLYSSQNIIRVTKLRQMRWAAKVACMGERRGAYKVLVGKS